MFEPYYVIKGTAYFDVAIDTLQGFILQKHLVSLESQKEEAMPLIGDTKQVYCPICAYETTWEYILVEHEDGVFGFQNLLQPELHRVRVWRCCNYITHDGKKTEECRKKIAHERHAHTKGLLD